MYAGLGDDLESWSYDGYQSSKYHNENDNNYSESYGESWKTGDVVGCLYDADAKKITFFKNGKNLYIVFTFLLKNDFISQTNKTKQNINMFV